MSTLDQQILEEARQALRVSEEQYRSLADFIPGVMWTARPDGSVDFANQFWFQFTGLTMAETEGMGWASMLHPDDVHRVFQVWNRALKTGATVEVEYRLKRAADGAYRWFLARGKPLRDQDGRIVKWFGLLTEIEEQKRLEAERAQLLLREQEARAEAVAAKEAAESANLAKSEFLSRMSHELRTPLNAILGFAQLLEMRPDGPTNTEHVKLILKAGRHLLGLINDVLDLARIETGRINLRLEPVRIGDVFTEVLDLVRPLAERHLVQSALALPDPAALDVHVLADEQRLKQVLLNLVTNAVKYNREQGSVTLSLEELAEARVRLLVRDTGPGLAPQQQQRLFNAFDRLGAEASDIEGTGLGLVVSKRLAEQMGGSLKVESAPGVGSTFFVDLPAASCRDRRVKVDSGAYRPLNSPSNAKRTVLYIEDNADNLALVQNILACRPEVRLLAAAKASLGLDLARQEKPHVILLDVHLPDMPGDQVLQRLQADPRMQDTPVIVLSADATAHQIERLRAAGACEYVTKPISVGRFLALLDRYLQ
jgi:PAS domain S-box-containing protein